MEYKEIPSEHDVIAALERLNGHATARKLCEELVDKGHPRRDSQLAIQRTEERGLIVVEHDWSVRLPQSGRSPLSFD